jgi:hypothetical protein
MSETRPAGEGVIEAEATVLPPQAMQRASEQTIGYRQGGLQMRTMRDALEWGEWVIRSGFAPRGFTRASQVIVATQTGHELGLGPAASLRAFYVPPDGRPQLYAEAAHALVAKSGLLEDFKQFPLSGEGDERAAEYRVKRRGQDWKSYIFTLGRAKRAGYIKEKSGWAKDPDAMLVARAKSIAYHSVFPDVLLGVAIEGDIPPEDEPTPGAPTIIAPVVAVRDPLLDETPADDVPTLPRDPEVSVAQPEAVTPDTPTERVLAIVNCKHEPAKAYLADHPRVKRAVVCEDCTLNVKLVNGLVVLAGE